MGVPFIGFPCCSSFPSEVEPSKVFLKVCYSSPSLGLVCPPSSRQKDIEHFLEMRQEQVHRIHSGAVSDWMVRIGYIEGFWGQRSGWLGMRDVA